MRINRFENYFDKENGRLTDSGSDVLLVFTVFCSWLLYPVMLKFLAYTQFQAVFIIISVAVLIVLIRYSKFNHPDWSGWHKWFMFLWGIYLFFLCVASIRSGNMYSVKQFCIILYKVMCFAALLFYMKRNFIVWSFRLYSHFMIVTVLLACVVSVGVGLDIMEPIQKLTDIVAKQNYHFLVYWGAYYHNPIYFITDIHRLYPVFRMEGFSEEPGTFAFAILPALYWFLCVEKSAARVLIIAIGVLASLSKGGGIAILLLLPLLFKPSFKHDRYMVLSLVAVCLSLVCMVLVFKFLPSTLYIQYLLSGGDRLTPILKSFAFLPTHPFGVGSALGMDAIHYPNFGYSNAFVEAGYLGGAAYCAMFGLLGWKALRLSLVTDMAQEEGRIRFVVAIVVMLVLFMGAQRQAPDISLWHMWIYASFFYLTMQKKEGLTSEHTELDESESQKR